MLIDPTGMFLYLQEFVGVNSSKMEVRRVAQVSALEEDRTKERMEGFVMIKENKD